MSLLANNPTTSRNTILNMSVYKKLSSRAQFYFPNLKFVLLTADMHTDTNNKK